jgi:queuine tRNA-ribosyltransferase
MATGFGFEVVARDGGARQGRLTTPNGGVDTPAFMPVATYGAVRGVAASELGPIGAQILLSNTYHLEERPGSQVIRAQGGLHGFTGWRGPWLTDSGGYQVTSLANRMKLDEQGVTFESPIDGRRRLLTPEGAIEAQQNLGSDVAMVLDECLPKQGDGGSSNALRTAAERTLRWAERSAKARSRAEQAVFGIVQGGTDADLRRHCAAQIASLGFEGFAHGGLGLGEEPAQRDEMVAAANEELPAAAPRYLMGLGYPADLVNGIAAGVDLFDCVIPTRHARHGVLFTHEGVLKIKNARYREDASPPDAQCDCPTCAVHSRAYLRHLIQTGETLGARLATVHNLRFYLRLMEQARAAIAAGAFAALQSQVNALSQR